MTLAEQSIPGSKQHRGCGIRAASYSTGPQSWLPEACVWLETEAGLRRLWVRSFAHCFDAEKLTFLNKKDADNWAFCAAEAIIDRALEFSSAAGFGSRESTASSTPKWRLIHFSIQLLDQIRRFRLFH